jgi:hypothetical protein
MILIVSIVRGERVRHPASTPLTHMVVPGRISYGNGSDHPGVKAMSVFEKAIVLAMGVELN